MDYMMVRPWSVVLKVSTCCATGPSFREVPNRPKGYLLIMLSLCEVMYDITGAE